MAFFRVFRVVRGCQRGEKVNHKERRGRKGRWDRREERSRVARRYFFLRPLAGAGGNLVFDTPAARGYWVWPLPGGKEIPVIKMPAVGCFSGVRLFSLGAPFSRTALIGF